MKLIFGSNSRYYLFEIALKLLQIAELEAILRQ